MLNLPDIFPSSNFSSNPIQMLETQFKYVTSCIPNLVRNQFAHKVIEIEKSYNDVVLRDCLQISVQLCNMHVKCFLFVEEFPFRFQHLITT